MVHGRPRRAILYIPRERNRKDELLAIKTWVRKVKEEARKKVISEVFCVLRSREIMIPEVYHQHQSLLFLLMRAQSNPRRHRKYVRPCDLLIPPTKINLEACP